MKLLSNHELAKFGDAELSGMAWDLGLALVRTSRGTPERRNTLASLENIDRVRSYRRYGCRL
jgi:hypothetical protein